MLGFLKRIRKSDGRGGEGRPDRALIELDNLVKTYETEAGDFVALHDIDLAIERGEFVTVVGKSGSGKTTLINMLTGIDRPTEGKVFVDEVAVHDLTENQTAQWRGDTVGVVFQFFQLLPTLSVIENVMLPMALRRKYTHRERYERALRLLDMVGIQRHAHKLPSQVSGGEQQRVAIARAIANDPAVIIADEPTGNLDSATAAQVFGVFEGLVEGGRTVLVVTHDPDLAKRSSRTLTIADGAITGDTRPDGELGANASAPTEASPLKPATHIAEDGFERWQDAIPGTLWRKVIRDLWNNKARTILVVLAIAVGVFAFGGMFTAREISLGAANHAYEAAHPADMYLYGSFDDHTVRVVGQMPGVVEAEGWGGYWLKMQSPTDPDFWYNMDLYALDDYEAMDIDQITFIEGLEGSWPPGPRQVLFERATAELLGLDIGTMVTLEMPDGSRRELQYAGIVYDVNAEPPRFSLWPRGYASMETLRWLGYDGSYFRMTIDAEGSAVENPDAAWELLGDITGRLERSGVSSEGYVNELGEHWVAQNIRTFGTIIGGLGVFALILSGFLVVNTTLAIIAQQKRQIGMMKAVGASGRQVMGVYLATASIFGLLALLVAVPMGAGLAYLTTIAVARFVNIDATNFYLPPWVLLLQVLAALAAPAVAALIPILGGTRVTVRQAVSDYGVGPVRRRGLINRLLARIRGLPRPTMLSLRNTFRRRGRLVLTLITLTLAGGIFISVVSTRNSLMVELENARRLFNFDVQVMLGGPYPTRQVHREAMRVPGVESVEGWAFAQAQLIPEGWEGSEQGVLGPNFTLYGTPADTTFVEPVISEGRWLQPGDQNVIVVSSDLVNDQPGLAVGQDVTLVTRGDEVSSRRQWRVVGVFNGFGQHFAYTNYDYLSHVVGAPGQSWVLLAGTTESDSQSQFEVARALEERLKRAGLVVGQSLTTSEITGANMAGWNFIITFMLVMAFLLAIVGGLGLAGTMSLNVLERTREIGVMRATGASNGAVRGVVLIEGIAIGLLSWLLAVPLSLPLGYGFNYMVSMSFLERATSFSFSATSVIIWLLIVLVIATVASLLPARRAVQVSVREALAYE